MQKEINEFILSRYYDFLDKKDSAEEQKKKELEQQDKLLAIQLLKEGATRPRRKTAAKPKEKVKRSAPPNLGFNAIQNLSPQLLAVTGLSEMSRPQVVKKLWEYIRANSLQDEKDKRVIRCDEKLHAVFKKLSVGAFEMNKFIGGHLYKADDLAKRPKKEPVKSETVNDTGSGEDNGAPSTSQGNSQANGYLDSEISDVDD